MPKNFINTEVKSVGILLPNLLPSQLSYCLINNINDYIKNNNDLDFIGYIETPMVSCVETMFPIMPVESIYRHNGVLIATNINLAHTLLTIGGDIYFYLWDFEFMRGPTINENIFSSAIQNPDIKIICRSNSHSKFTKSTFNLSYEPQVCDDFNIEQLKNII